MEARKWSSGQADWEQVFPHLRRQVVTGEKMTITRYRFDVGGRFPHHVHDQEQMSYVVSGEITFTVNDQPFPLETGDVIVIPASTPHDAEAGAHGAEVLSVVSPSRAGDSSIEMLQEV